MNTEQLVARLYQLEALVIKQATELEVQATQLEIQAARIQELEAQRKKNVVIAQSPPRRMVLRKGRLNRAR